MNLHEKANNETTLCSCSFWLVSVRATVQMREGNVYDWTWAPVQVYTMGSFDLAIFGRQKIIMMMGFWLVMRGLVSLNFRSPGKNFFVV